MRTTCIYHAHGTLDMRHIRLSLESLGRQKMLWDRFVIYNGGGPPTAQWRHLIPERNFQCIEEFPYDPGTPKSSVADWWVQMRMIGDADRYFVHKADMYLADGVCEAFDALPRGADWFVPFHRIDTRARATVDDFRRIAKLLLLDVLNLPETHVGSWRTERSHLSPPLFFPFLQVPGNYDGSMHGYTDGVRPLYAPSKSEREARWCLAQSLRDLAKRVSFITSDRFWAAHIYHESPDRTDWNSGLEPEERY